MEDLYIPRATMGGSIYTDLMCVGCHSMEWNFPTCSQCGKEHTEVELRTAELLADQYKETGKIK